MVGRGLKSSKIVGRHLWTVPNKSEIFLIGITYKENSSPKHPLCKDKSLKLNGNLIRCLYLDLPWICDIHLKTFAETTVD